MRGKFKYSRGLLLIGNVIDSNVDHNLRSKNYRDMVDGLWIYWVREDKFENVLYTGKEKWNLNFIHEIIN